MDSKLTERDNGNANMKSLEIRVMSLGTKPTTWLSNLTNVCENALRG